MVHKADFVIIGISVGLTLGILIASLIFCGLRWFKKRTRIQQSAKEQCITTLPIRTHGIGTSTDFSASLSNSVTIQVLEDLKKNSHHSGWNHANKDPFASASGINRYSYKDIQKATQNFTTTLGQGSFGPVYKATMPTGDVAAVKVLASNSKQGEKEFQTEVLLLGRLHHRNLVNLVGYCVDKGQHMLIYEFMSSGSLENLLYVLEQANPPVIHRDLKTANILLDQSMRTKVADFGLSKEEVFDGQNSGLGYIDPAYVSTNKFTMKSDIYSFGIIMFELITAIHPHQNLLKYINLASMSQDGIDEILDECLAGECNIEEARALASIAHKCLKKSSRKRPSIVEISQAILKIKQRRLMKDDTMSFVSWDFSLVASRIGDQQGDLSVMTSIIERAVA